MKAFIKILLKIFLGLIVLIVVFLFGIYWYISTEWKKYYTEDEIRAFANKIESTPPLSNSFYLIYDKLSNNDRHKTITAVYSSAIWNMSNVHNRNKQHCWAERASQFFPKKDGMRGYPDFILAWGLEKFTKPEKCFDFALTKRNEQLRQNDTTFKDITQIKDTSEILEYLIISDAPSLYRGRPERVNQLMLALRAKLNE